MDITHIVIGYSCWLDDKVKHKNVEYIRIGARRLTEDKNLITSCKD